MADTTNIKSVLKVIATTSDRVQDLSVDNGQLIFLKDVGRIAFDFNDIRVFYNQIVELETDAERLSLEAPLSGYYFVISTGILWYYRYSWVQVTDKPQEVVFVGVELPLLGQANKIYVNITEGSENISVWNESSGTYVIVGEKTQSMTSEEVVALFNN